MSGDEGRNGRIGSWEGVDNQWVPSLVLYLFIHWGHNTKKVEDH